MTAPANIRPAMASVPAILCDLVTVKQRLACHYARREQPSDEEDRQWTALEDRKADLERQFADAFYRATGTLWELAQEIMA